MKANNPPTTKILSSLLAALMLLVAVAGKSWSVASPPMKGKTEQSTKKTTDGSATDGSTTVSALSLHAVVTPAVSFDFAQSVFVLPHTFLYHVQEKVAIPLASLTPFYYFSYFRHIFGHYIAPNAP